MLLLQADSDQPLPDTDAEVVAALKSYQKNKALAHARLDLLAGLMWVHAHQLDLHVGLRGATTRPGNGIAPRL